MLGAFLRSPSLRAALGFGLGGAAFTIGNLILARALPAREYGVISLVIGLVSVASQMAPLGIDLVVTRRGFRLGTHLRRAALAASLLSASATALVGALVYGLTVTLALCVLAATIAAGMLQAAAAHFQSQGLFRTSVPILQASNWMLVPVGLISAMAGTLTATMPALLLAGSSIAVALLAWWLMLRQDDGVNTATTTAGLWREALSLMSVIAASSVFLQLERLVMPGALGLNELALFGVLAALVGSPFRIVQAAIGFTVIPGLRDAPSVAARRQLLRHEGTLVAVVLLMASVGIWIVAPPLAHWLLAGRYDLSHPLMLATLVSGVLKVLSATGTGVVNALAPEAGVRRFSVGSWACIAIATVGSFLAAPWGLVGVLYAISAGWLLRCLISGWISWVHLRTPASS